MRSNEDMQDVEKLIDLVKNRPAIYDYSRSDHKNKEYTDKLWKQISIEMNMPTYQCKSKWLALRNSYSRELRNEKEANTNPYIKKKRRKWYLADDMLFLRKFLNYGQNPETDEKPNVDDDFNNNNDNDSISSLTIDESETKFHVPDDEEMKLKFIPTQSNIFDTLRSTTATTTTSTESFMKETFDENSFLKKKLPQDLSEQREQNMTFFKSILPDILKLSERRQRIFKQEVLLVLNSSLDQQEMAS